MHAKTTMMDQNVVVAVLDSTATQDVSNVLVIFEVQSLPFVFQTVVVQEKAHFY